MNGWFLALNGDSGEGFGEHCRYLTLAGFRGTQGWCNSRRAAAGPSSVLYRVCVWVDHPETVLSSRPETMGKLYINRRHKRRPQG